MSSQREVLSKPRQTRDLPTFIVIGAMKAGTTSLYHYLRNHDEIFMSGIKELDFFVEESNWSRGLDWYRQQFNGAGVALARGEASTLYTKFPEHAGVPGRIARVVPDVRLVYVVRDPIVRLRSHYQHLVMTGAEKAPPEVALIENPTYIACSKYAMQIEQYLDHFAREQILVVTSEALRSNRRATVKSVYEFLGVNPARVPDVLDTEFYRTAQRQKYPPVVLWARRMAKTHAVNMRRGKALIDSVLAWRRIGAGSSVAPLSSRPASVEARVITPALRRQLADLLHEDVARFRRYMPPDFDGWGLG